MIYISFIDHTYKPLEKGKIPRRLRALGGGIRRLLKISLDGLKPLTKNEIFVYLDIYTILGNSKKIYAQLFAVKNNTKLPNDIR